MTESISAVAQIQGCNGGGGGGAGGGWNAAEIRKALVMMESL